MKKNNSTYLFESPNNKKSVPWDYVDFVNKLIDIQKKTKYVIIENPCKLCNYKKKVKVFTLKNIVWESILVHYIKKHHIKPSSEFMDFIYRYFDNPEKKTLLKIGKNQLYILDALMKHGSTKYYSDKKNKKIFRYSEHAGLLHFDNNKLAKIVVFANTTRVDEIDSDIYLPKENDETFEYEYFFHTHPPTPKPGGRAELGILYEFPSINDIFHYIDHCNDGNTKGSIIMAAEGLYIIRKINKNIKKITVDEDKLFNEYNKLLDECQDISIKKYYPFNNNKFYNIIAQDLTYINKINELLQNFHLWIDFYPRSKDNKGRWFVDTIYL